MIRKNMHLQKLYIKKANQLSRSSPCSTEDKTTKYVHNS